MNYKVEVKDIPQTPTIVLRGVTTVDKLGEHFMDVMPRLGKYATGSGMNIIGPPFARYFDYTPDHVDLEAGFPLANPVSGSDGFQASELPATTVATLTHMGNYDGLKDAYAYLSKWIEENGHQFAGAPWEVYVTDPGTEPDPAKWRTDVFWPIK